MSKTRAIAGLIAVFSVILPGAGCNGSQHTGQGGATQTIGGASFTLELAGPEKASVNEPVCLDYVLMKRDKKRTFVDVTQLGYPHAGGYALKWQFIPAKPPLGDYWGSGGNTVKSYSGIRFFALMDSGYRELPIPVKCGAFAAAGVVRGSVAIHLRYYEEGNAAVQHQVVSRGFTVKIESGSGSVGPPE